MDTYTNIDFKNTKKEHIYPVIRGIELEANSSSNIIAFLISFIGVSLVGYLLYNPALSLMSKIDWINNILPYFHEYYLVYYCSFLFICFIVSCIVLNDRVSKNKNPEIYDLFEHGESYVATVMDYKDCEMNDYSYYLILRISTNEGPKDVEYKLRKKNKPFVIGTMVTIYIKEDTLFIYELLG